MEARSFLVRGIESPAGCRFLVLGEGELGEVDDFASLLGGFVGEDAGAGDVGGLDGVRVALAVSAEEFDKLVGEVRVGSAVAAALGEGKVLCAVIATVDAAGGERGDFVGKEVGVIRALDFFGNFRLGLFRSVNDERFAFDQRPLDRFLGSVNFERFAVLAGDVEE